MIGGTYKKAGIALKAAVAGIALGAVTPATAADLGGGYADLEERIAELEATSARKGNRKVSLTVSGLVNEAILFWDDGVESNAYVGTQESAQSRFRFVGDATIAPGWKAGYLLEIGIRGSRLDRVNQDVADGGGAADKISTRHSAWWLSSKDYGKLWLGLTSDAADGITEINLANTNHFASANKQNLGDGGGGFHLRQGQALRNLQWGDFVVPGAAQGIPGDGHRANLVKYETPTIAGFIASASWGADDLWNIALRYKGEAAGFQFAAGIAYTEYSDSSAGLLRGVGDTSEVGLSASLLHTGTGLFLTGAYGYLEDEDQIGTVAYTPDKDTDFFFVQAGIERNFFQVGKTTLFGEYWNLDRGAAVFAGTGNLTVAAGQDTIAGSEIKGWGIGINQNFSEVFDLYLLYNHVSIDITTANSLTGAKAGVAGLIYFEYFFGG